MPISGEIEQAMRTARVHMAGTQGIKKERSF